MNTRTLTLRREHLAELTDADLADVAAAAITDDCPTIWDKITQAFDTLQATRCFCP